MKGRIEEKNIHFFPSKAAVIIDGGYWRRILNSYNIENVDLVNFTDSICTPAYRLRSYFFDGKTQENQSFHDSLQMFDRFEVFLGEVAPRNIFCPNCSTNFNLKMQKRVDVALAVELVHLATSRQVDVIILIAGDRDFIPAIETAKHAGVIIKLVHGPLRTVSDSLLKLVDEKLLFNPNYLNLNNIKWVERVISTLIKSDDSTEDDSEQVTEVVDQLINILSDLITSTNEEYHNLSTVGLELTTLNPEWKEKTKTKKLINLISDHSNVFTYRKEGIDIHLSLMNLNSVKLENSSQIDDLETFLLTVILGHDSTSSDSLTMGKLGYILQKTNPKWKKKYKIKTLKKALVTLGNKIIIRNVNNDYRISLP